MASARRHIKNERPSTRRARRSMEPRAWGWAVLVALVVALVAGVVVVGEADSERPATRHHASRTDQGPTGINQGAPPAGPFRAFEPNSWWNTPLPADAPLDANGEKILHYLRTAPESGKGCLTLAGAGSSNWGTPIYWAAPSDPVYDVQGVPDGPPELHHLRIPVRAEPADNNDGTMSIYDLSKGYVVALTDANYHPWNNTWTASGATVTYLDSNGLNVGTGRSDNPHNRGTHRGNNGATMAVQWAEVNQGAIRHVLKVAIGPEASKQYVFPMTGSDGGYHGDSPAVPPEGLRLRIKPSVDLSSLPLSGQALVIAKALQRYGFYIGDSGGSTALKLENTRAEGRGQLWNVTTDALCGLRFLPRYWDVIAPGYDPTR